MNAKPKTGNGSNRRWLRDALIGFGGIGLGSVLLQPELALAVLVELAKNSGETLIISAAVLVGVNMGVNAVREIGGEVKQVAAAQREQAVSMSEMAESVKGLADQRGDLEAIKASLGSLHGKVDGIRGAS